MVEIMKLEDDGKHFSVGSDIKEIKDLDLKLVENHLCESYFGQQKEDREKAAIRHADNLGIDYLLIQESAVTSCSGGLFIPYTEILSLTISYYNKKRA